MDWQRFSNPNGARSELTEQTRSDYEQQVRGPGKFQGEPAYVPYFHDVAGHGFVDEEASWPEGGGWVGIFSVDEKDVAMFPELKGKKKVALYERSDGFVGEMSVKNARAEMEEMNAAYEDESGDDEIEDEDGIED